VVVDVLSFSTTVAVATARGAEVWPIGFNDERALSEAQRIGAELARRRRAVTAAHPYSLSPVSVSTIEPGTRLVLPSPNGARLCEAARGSDATLLVGSLRNASAVAAAAAGLGTPVAVVAAGERWPDGSLRPALEDLLGAGAVVERLASAHRLDPSPDARAAAAAFRAADLAADLSACTSGRELAADGYAEDVALAAQLDATDVAPVMGRDGWVRGGGNVVE
jgi:2-phosphosulfolactate phosphatase